MRQRVVNFVRMVVHSKMMSFRLMANIYNVVKGTIMPGDVIGHIGEAVARSDQFMEPIAIFCLWSVVSPYARRIGEKAFLPKFRYVPDRDGGPCPELAWPLRQEKRLDQPYRWLFPLRWDSSSLSYSPDSKWKGDSSQRQLEWWWTVSFWCFGAFERRDLLTRKSDPSG